jgi:predicted GNAT family acetyltransferase
MAPTLPPISHNLAAHAFECVAQGHRCFAEYELADGTMRMTHTVVHPDLRGQGIAAALVEAALAYAESQSLKVVPLCSYVRAYLQRHKPEGSRPLKDG